MSDSSERLLLALDGFEGPMDLLLDLARAQKVDLARISIVALVDQYLAVIEGARRIRLELAADWLVMAAWLTWLKSRLLLPAGPEAEEAAETADMLAARLHALELARAGAQWLSARGMLGQDVFVRGAPEDYSEIDRSGLAADLPSLLRGYLGSVRRVAARRAYAPRQMTLNFWTVQDALQRLTATLGSMPEWSALEKFLPADLVGQEHRAAVASTLIASLELARSGGARLRQDAPFAPILVAASSANEA
jgi:segregation and condensation protein A